MVSLCQVVEMLNEQECEMVVVAWTQQEKAKTMEALEGNGLADGKLLSTGDPSRTVPGMRKAEHGHDFIVKIRHVHADSGTDNKRVASTRLLCSHQ